MKHTVAAGLIGLAATAIATGGLISSASAYWPAKGYHRWHHGEMGHHRRHYTQAERERWHREREWRRLGIHPEYGGYHGPHGPWRGYQQYWYRHER